MKTAPTYLLHRTLAALALVAAAMSMPFVLTPGDGLAARWQSQVLHGGLGAFFGEAVLRHWADDSDAPARRAYLDILADREDAESQHHRMRLLRDAAITGDAVAATELADLSYSARLGGDGRASLVQITRWYRQGARAGIAEAVHMLDVMAVTGLLEQEEQDATPPSFELEPEAAETDLPDTSPLAAPAADQQSPHEA